MDFNESKLYDWSRVSSYWSLSCRFWWKDTKKSLWYNNSNIVLKYKNGGTKFKESGEFVQSKKNRLVKFPTPVCHAGVWATDAKLRYVLNMTYETK